MPRLLLALALALPLLATGRAEPPQDPKAEWTLLIYANADTNLEVACVINLEAMVQSIATDRVNIVVQVDREEKDEPEGEGFTARGLGDLENFWSTKRLVFKPGRLEELEDLGEKNSGDPKTLASFIAWGVKNFPARRTALVFMDHGAGWSGWGGDHSHKGDVLSVQEISAGMEAGRKSARLGRFDVVVFESCLMANLEVARACRPHAKLLVGSEEISYIGGGVYWRNFITALSKKPDVDGDALARLFADEWRGFFDNSQSESVQEMGKAFPLSVVDLDKLGGLIEAMDALCDALVPKLRNEGRKAWLRVAAARHASEEYGKLADGSFHCRDLHHFVRGLTGLGIDDERAALLKALDDAVPYRIPCTKRPKGRGLSVFFPSTKKEFDGLGARVNYPAIACSAKWAGLLKIYYELQSTDTTAPRTTKPESTAKELKRGQQVRLKTTVSADDIAEGYFVLGWPMEDEVWIMGSYPVDLKKDPLDCEFDGTWLAVGDGKKKLWACVVSYEETEFRHYIVGMPVHYAAPRAKSDSQITIFFTVQFDKNWKYLKGSYLYAFEYAEHGPSQVQLKQGGTVRPLYYVVGQKGEDVEPRKAKETLTVGAGGLKISEEGLPEGKYVLGYQVIDLAGNETFDGIEITLKP